MFEDYEGFKATVARVKTCFVPDLREMLKEEFLRVTVLEPSPHGVRLEVEFGVDPSPSRIWCLSWFVPYDESTWADELLKLVWAIRLVHEQQAETHG